MRRGLGRGLGGYTFGCQRGRPVAAPLTVGGTLTITSSPTEDKERAQLLNWAASASLCADVASRQAQELILRSRQLRAGINGSPRFFVLHGSVENRSVRASWFRGHLLASPTLRLRADMLVDLGERFVSEPGAPEVVASLSAPGAALLTLVRSCDHVKLVKLGPMSRAFGLEDVVVCPPSEEDVQP